MKHVLSLLLVFVLFSLCAFAQTNITTSADTRAKVRQDLALGIGTHFKTTQISSLANAMRKAGEFANYVHERSGYRLAPDFVNALTDAEWRARSASRGSINVSVLAATATRLFLSKLGEPPTSVPTADRPTPFFIVTPEKFNGARLFYVRHAPQVILSDMPDGVRELNPARADITSVQVAYPVESMLALYACITDDMGRDVSQVRAERRVGSSSVSAPSNSRRPYGDYGYLTRRPLSTLFSADIMRELLALMQ
jgi:hypothetical protein